MTRHRHHTRRRQSTKRTTKSRHHTYKTHSPPSPKRLYDQVAWRKASKQFLSDNPLCVYCDRQGKERASKVTDHIEPHNGDPILFWDRSNWQPLCATCHGVKRRQDHGKPLGGADIEGLPIDPQHHWSG